MIIRGQPIAPSSIASANSATREITGLLTSVGFGSPPAWIRPYHVLSRGEQFRCDLARACAQRHDPRESRVNRRAAACGVRRVHQRCRSQRGARSARPRSRNRFAAGHTPCRFVAVTCHYDVAEWLEPDWVVDMHTRTSQRRRLRRPAIELALRRCHRRLWRMFAPHHYLSGSLSVAARCYAAFWEGQPVSVLRDAAGYWPPQSLADHAARDTARLSKASASACAWPRPCANLHRAAGCRINVTASHPAMIAHCRQPPLAYRARHADRLGQHATVHRRLSQLGRPQRGVFRISGEQHVSEREEIHPHGARRSEEAARSARS